MATKSQKKRMEMVRDIIHYRGASDSSNYSYVPRKFIKRERLQGVQQYYAK